MGAWWEDFLNSPVGPTYDPYDVGTASKRYRPPVGLGMDYTDLGDYGMPGPQWAPTPMPETRPMPTMPGIGMPGSTDAMPNMFGGNIAPIMPQRQPPAMTPPPMPGQPPQMPTLGRAPLPAFPELNDFSRAQEPVNPMARPILPSDSSPPSPAANYNALTPNPFERVPSPSGALPVERFGPGPGAAPPTTGERVHFGVRNNNPLNIMGDPAQLSKVYSGITGNYETRPGMSYLKFDTPEAGIAAAAQTIRYHYGKGVDTPAKLMATLAPPVPGHGNDPVAYGNIVAKALGVGPNDKVDFRDPAVLAKVLPAIFQTETGMRNLPYTPEMYAAALSGQRGTPTVTASLEGAPRGLPPSPAEPKLEVPPTASTSAEPPSPGFFARNNLGPDAPLWGFMQQTGAGLASAPRGSNFWEAANQGLAAGNQYLRQGPKEKLQLELLKAQVGEHQAKADTLKTGKQLAGLTTDMTAKMYLSLGLFEKGVERLNTINPEEAKRVTQAIYDKEKATVQAKQDVTGGDTEVAKIMQDIKLAKQRGDQPTVDALQAKLAKETLPPTAAQDQIQGMSEALSASAELRNLVQRAGTQSLDQPMRTEIKQQYSRWLGSAKKTYAFGAALTANEQAILEGMLSDPNKLFSIGNTLTGSETYLKILDKFEKFTRNFAANMEGMYKRGEWPANLKTPPTGSKLPPGWHVEEGDKK